MTDIPSPQPAHTPGPWELDDLGNVCSQAVHNIALVFSSSTREGWSGSDLDTQAHCEANARLIAASPELLEACQAIVAWDEAEKAARPWNEDGGKGWHERLDACALAFEKARAAIAKATGGAA